MSAISPQRKGNRKASVEIRWRLSENLRRLRKAQGYTQRELASLCGFSKTYISNVEQGTVNITLANLETICRGLDCFEEDLLRKPQIEREEPAGLDLARRRQG